MSQTMSIAFEGPPGAFTVKKVKGKFVFVKNYLLKNKGVNRALTKVVGVEKRALNLLNVKMPHDLVKKGFKKQKEELKAIIEKEVRTNRLWLENGVLTPRIIDYDSISLTSEFIPSKNFYELIGGDYKPSLLDEMFLAYQNIRMKSLSKDDPEMLHLDPHSKNFLKTSFGDVYAIDSSFLLKEGADTKTVDSIVNGLFLLQLENLNSDNEIFAANVEYCKKLFGSEIKRTKLPKINCLSILYFKLRENVAHKIKRRPYDFNESSFKNYEILRKIIS
ncbi:MAG: hypothetical protein ACMXX6_00325 [Candidatus Woesearchaeota archaeon]